VTRIESAMVTWVFKSHHHGAMASGTEQHAAFGMPHNYSLRKNDGKLAEPCIKSMQT
jgi:hypothetical protein